MGNYNVNYNNNMAQPVQLNEASSRDIVQADALAIATQHKRCGLGISMGVGKTRIAINHLLKNFNPFIKALVVIP